MPGQAAAALCTHRVPLVGHGTGAWRKRSCCHAGFILSPALQADILGLWVRCMRRVTVPICSFSKGSSISFRLASRRMSVHIYRQTEQRQASAVQKHRCRVYQKSTFVKTEFYYTAIDGTISLHISSLCSFCSLPCEQLLPDWPGLTDSLRPPCDCRSAQSPGRLCGAWGQDRQRQQQQLWYLSSPVCLSFPFFFLFFFNY